MGFLTGHYFPVEHQLVITDNGNSIISTINLTEWVKHQSLNNGKSAPAWFDINLYVTLKFGHRHHLDKWYWTVSINRLIN